MTYKEQLTKPEWQRKRLQIMDRDNLTCQYCGNNEDYLHIHHKEYHKGKKAWEYEDKFLITLCSHCHDVIEFYKKNDINIIQCFLLRNRLGEKSHLVTLSDNSLCSIWEFSTTGDLNGKELVMALPVRILNSIYHFLNTSQCPSDSLTPTIIKAHL